jgi:hypothetical protein
VLRGPSRVATRSRPPEFGGRRIVCRMELRPRRLLHILRRDVPRDFKVSQREESKQGKQQPMSRLGAARGADSVHGR